MYRDIPAQLITGFLGSGKTTAIRHLLQLAPTGERWAVLVNEFGKVGVDGALLESAGATVREVAGGCLCCVTSQAFTIGLGRLIREAKPHRILIEPSGLGHPRRLLEQLQAPPWQGVLDLRATLTLVDARQLGDARYREHPIFRQQIELADVLLGSKADTYAEADREALLDLAASAQPPKACVAFIEQGRIDSAWLDLKRDPRRCPPPRTDSVTMPAVDLKPEAEASFQVMDPWQRFVQRGEAHAAIGWRVHHSWCFETDEVEAWLDTLPVQRVKAVLRLCRGGALCYNRNGAEVQRERCQVPPVSRLELIDPDPPAEDTLDHQLRALAREH